MEIVIIGSGNVAHTFGHMLELSGHRIVQVISRDGSHAKDLAEKLNAQHTSDLNDISMDADVYLMAVTDKAVGELNQVLRLGKRIAAHTAGSLPLAAISRISTNTGVLYPLQSLRKEIKQLRPIPMLVEAGDKVTLSRLKTLAESISPLVREMDSEHRMKLHLAAVICNNFTNHMITLASDYCRSQSLDFNLLKPLLQETFERADRFDPLEMQTGPARRHDAGTLELHMQLLAGYPGLQELYRVLSDHIYHYYSETSEVPQS
jgi:predicted short-subunit dehydrogenase-like oxidoreductase (DUF2520 family)